MIRNEFNIFLVDRGINWKIRRPPGKLLRQWATRIYAFFRPIFLLILRSNENILDSFLKSSAYVNRNILITYTFEIDASRLYLVPDPQIKRVSPDYHPLYSPGNVHSGHMYSKKKEICDLFTHVPTTHIGKWKYWLIEMNIVCHVSYIIRQTLWWHCL